MKCFYHLLLPAFCLFVVSACVVSQSNVAGKINGTSIPYGSYMDAYRAHYNNFQVLNNRIPDKDENEQIKRQTWVDATKGVILKDYFAKYGISVSAQEAIDTLRANIPDFVRKSPGFMTSGVFDPNLYLQSLLYDTPQNLQPLRQDYQDFKIPIMHLQRRLLENELLTASESKLITRIMRSKADIRWTAIDPQNIKPIVTEEEIQAYYQVNRDRFKESPWYSVLWTALKVAPTPADNQLSKALADSLYLELSAGKVQSEVLSKQSYAPVVFKNSGFVRNLDLDPEIYALLVTLEPGTYSKPIADTEGVTIYQLDERTKSLSSFNTLRVPYLPSSASVKSDKPRADKVLRLAQTIGLTEACGEMDLELRRSGKVSLQQNWLSDVKLQQQVVDALRSMPANTLLEPVYSAADQAWLVIELKDNKLDSSLQLADARATILAELTAAKQADIASRLGSQFLTGQISVPAEAQTIEIKDMTLDTLLLDKSAENVFFQTLHRHFLKEPQQVLKLGDLVLVPEVVKVTANSDQEISPAAIRRLFVANQPADWFETWMAAKVKQAKVYIYAQ